MITSSFGSKLHVVLRLVTVFTIRIKQEEHKGEISNSKFQLISLLHSASLSGRVYLFISEWLFTISRIVPSL